MTRAICLDRSYCLKTLLIFLFSAGLVLFASGCRMGGAITFPDAESEGEDGGGGTSGGTVIAIASTDSSDMGGRGIVVEFDEAVDESLFEASVADEEGNDLRINNTFRSTNGKRYTIYGAFPYCANLNVTVRSSPNVVAMRSNPYDFDGSQYCTADYPVRYKYTDKDGKEHYYSFVLNGESIIASKGVLIDPYDFVDSLWNIDAGSTAFTMSDMITNMDGSGKVGFSAYRSSGLASIVTEATMAEMTALSAFSGTGYLSESGKECVVVSAQDIGDVDGDGINDISMNEVCEPMKGSSYYVVSIIKGQLPLIVGMVPTEVSAAAAEQGIIGYVSDAPSYSMANIAPEVADVNGDGLGDIVAVATNADLVGSRETPTTKTVYSSELLVYPGTANLSGMLDAPTVAIGMNTYMRIFNTVNTADVNADGISDIVATDGLVVFDELDIYTLNYPKIYIFFGRAEWPAGLTQADADVTIEKWNSYQGLTVRSGGDLNADGNEDLLINASYLDEVGEKEYKFFIMYGRDTWAKFYALERDYDVSIGNDKTYTLLDFSRVPVGDVDNDGYDDLIFMAGDSYYFFFRGVDLAGQLTPSDAYTYILITSSDKPPAQ
ncbi:MAG: hypothetical protein WC683_11380 [bacterium]